MQMTYDPSVDAFSIRWSDAEIDNSDEVEPGVILDYDQNGNVVGLEVLDYKQRLQILSTSSEKEPSMPAITTTLPRRQD